MSGVLSQYKEGWQMPCVARDMIYFRTSNPCNTQDAWLIWNMPVLTKSPLTREYIPVGFCNCNLISNFPPFKKLWNRQGITAAQPENQRGCLTCLKHRWECRLHQRILPWTKVEMLPWWPHFPKLLFCNALGSPSGAYYILWSCAWYQGTRP